MTKFYQGDIVRVTQWDSVAKGKLGHVAFDGPALAHGREQNPPTARINFYQQGLRSAGVPITWLVLPIDGLELVERFVGPLPAPKTVSQINDLADLLGGYPGNGLTANEVVEIWSKVGRDNVEDIITLHRHPDASVAVIRALKETSK